MGVNTLDGIAFTPIEKEAVWKRQAKRLALGTMVLSVIILIVFFIIVMAIILFPNWPIMLAAIIVGFIAWGFGYILEKII